MNKMYIARQRSTKFNQDTGAVEVVETEHVAEIDYSHMVAQKTAELESRNKCLMQTIEEQHKHLMKFDEAHFYDQEQIGYLNKQIESLWQNLEYKTRVAEQLEVTNIYQNEKLTQLEHEKKQMIGKLIQEKQNDRNKIEELITYVQVVERELQNHKEMILEKEDVFRKMHENFEDLTKYTQELSMTIEDERESKKILQEKLENAEGEIARLRQQNFSSSNSYTRPHNTLISEREEAAQEEINICMASQMLNAEDSTEEAEDGTAAQEEMPTCMAPQILNAEENTQEAEDGAIAQEEIHICLTSLILNAEDSTQEAEDESSCQGESRNWFDLKMLWSGRSFYSRMLATMVAVLLIVSVLISFNIFSKPSYNIESRVKIFQESLQSFLEQIVWHCWDIYHCSQLNFTAESPSEQFHQNTTKHLSYEQKN